MKHRHETLRPGSELIAALSGLATGTLANALDDLGCRERVIAGLTAVARGFRLAGPAVTVKEVWDDYGRFASEDFKVGKMIDAAGPGDVLVVDAGASPYSTWGGMASYAAKLKGIAGLVVDGSVRDLEEIVDFAFPVFARQVTPVSGRMRLKVEAINVPVDLGGVEVMPGDIIVADGSGVVSLPAARAAEITALAGRLARDDEAALEDLKAGLTFTEAMAKYKRI